ncbi:asparagine synthase (glutamine-hydrolyzing) [Algoriphagus marincola]|uniref:asparagine synthase (glutamine-hydrolyzing) n=1 Tax=Algoriphagus marincola TaxID=264027 RepID=A0ABS7N3I5_9BACT|nr:asparagine synthase (glutamine-hydrolyzing) [Algoriphagus marincola]MBY5950893.1 asparagine synthase (glutamine-hydrolyzing) [Algoriphagus marincola]
MCGVAAIVGPKASLQNLEAILALQHHRGPDYTGYWVEPNQIALGHNRLSIIDLSAAANQPFVSSDGRYHLVFNGEIYNYLELKQKLRFDFEFKTNSDTEVLLAAFIKWGKECLAELNGMFAFIIWDKKDQSLFAARDRFGVKPLYFSQLTDSLILSSEIRPHWQIGIPKVPNSDVWHSYLTKGQYGMPDETFWKGIHQIPGGHYLTLKNGDIEIRSWYDFVTRSMALINHQENDEEAYILDLLKDSVRLRFRADVPVGFNLSGGLDSSTLLALVSDAYPDEKKIEAFTFFTGDERYDELPWVRQMLVGKPYPLNTCKLEVSDIPYLTQKIASVQDEPFGGIPTLAYAKVFEEARKKGFLVLLDGQGSDEAWAGYDYYLKNTTSLIQGTNTSPVRPEALTNSLKSMGSREIPMPFSDELLNKQFRDIFYTKIPRALRFNDRVSMAFSTELREPFLDYRLVEYVFSRSRDFKIKDGQQKWLLRKIAAKYLGDDIALAPKRPLQTPQREWLGGPLASWVEEKIEFLKANIDWFDPESLDVIWKEYKNGNQENSFYIWQWVNTAEVLQ